MNDEQWWAANAHCSTGRHRGNHRAGAPRPSRRGTTATVPWRTVCDRIPLRHSRTRQPPAGSTLGDVTIAEQPAEPGVKVYPPDEALRRAKPLPPRERFVIEDVPQDDWTAFREALAEA